MLSEYPKKYLIFIYPSLRILRNLFIWIYEKRELRQHIKMSKEDNKNLFKIGRDLSVPETL